MKAYNLFKLLILSCVIVVSLPSLLVFGFHCDSVCLHESQSASKPLLTYVSCWVYKSKHCFSRALGVEEDRMMHGNYCGSGRLSDDFEMEPIDDLDKACMEHDKCYHDFGDWNEDCDRVFARAVWDLWVKLKSDPLNRNENTELSEKAFLIMVVFGGRTLFEDLSQDSSELNHHRAHYEKALNNALALGLQITSEQILSQIDLGESEEGKFMKKGLKDFFLKNVQSIVSYSKPYLDSILDNLFGSSEKNSQNARHSSYREL